MKVLVMYHEQDLDGRCAGFIAGRHLGYWNHEVHYFPCLYGLTDDDIQRICDQKFDAIHMVDFSLPVAQMIRLRTSANGTFYVIDHHKSCVENIAAAGERFLGTQIDSGPHLVDGAKIHGLSGCELAWKWFHPREPVPRAVRLIGRYDVWDHENHPDAKPFYVGLWHRNLPVDDPRWNALFSNESLVDDCISEGKAILKHKTEEDAKYAKTYAFDAILAADKPYRVVVLNRGFAGTDMFASVYDPARHDFMVGIILLGVGNYKVSLRSSKDEFDMCAIARFFNGGGHKGAAGFNLDNLDFLSKIPE